MSVLPSEKLRDKIRVRNPLIRNALSEFFGTTVLLFIVTGIVVQFVLSEKQLNTWIQINLGAGLAIGLSVYVCSHTSGGHFNPAISLAMVTLGNLGIKDFFVYFIAQLFGTIVGTAGAYAVYLDQFNHFDSKYNGGQRVLGGKTGTGDCFCSYPAQHVSNSTAFFDQVFGTSILLFFLCAVVDKRNRIPAAAHPLLIGLIVVVIGTSYGMNLGYPINPARDLGPRIFSYFIYGKDVFTAHGYYFWIPVIAPLIGGPLGAWLYHFFIGAHIPDVGEEYIHVDESKRILHIDA